MKELREQVEIDEADGFGSGNITDHNQLKPDTITQQNKFKESLSMLAIAYFNLGCEYEHLN